VVLHDDDDGRWAYVSDFYIEPSHRRQGHGRCFVQVLTQSLADQGITRIDLPVREDNPASLAFLQAVGFRLASYRLRQY